MSMHGACFLIHCTIDTNDSVFAHSPIRPFFFYFSKMANTAVRISLAYVFDQLNLLQAVKTTYKTIVDEFAPTVPSGTLESLLSIMAERVNQMEDDSYLIRHWRLIIENFHSQVVTIVDRDEEVYTHIVRVYGPARADVVAAYIVIATLFATNASDDEIDLVMSFDDEAAFTWPIWSSKSVVAKAPVQEYVDSSVLLRTVALYKKCIPGGTLVVASTLEPAL
jgi:hypothetical protein